MRGKRDENNCPYSVYVNTMYGYGDKVRVAGCSIFKRKPVSCQVCQRDVKKALEEK